MKCRINNKARDKSFILSANINPNDIPKGREKEIDDIFLAMAQRLCLAMEYITVHSIKELEDLIEIEK